MLISWKKESTDTNLASYHGSDICLGDDVSLRPEIYEFLREKSIASPSENPMMEHLTTENSPVFFLDATWLEPEPF